MRNYKKRTKSTQRKTYADYIQMRSDLESKGYTLQDVMSKESFEEAYENLRNAKRAGEIKSQPWAELKRREAYMFGDKRLKIFRAYAQEMTGEYVSIGEVKRYSKEQIAALGQFISANNGLFGGKYE